MSIIKYVVKRVVVGFGAVLGALAPCSVLANPITLPGATTGIPAGVVPPEGFYFANVVTGIQTSSGAWAPGCTGATCTQFQLAAEVPVFIWSPGWNFLGASVAGSIAPLTIAQWGNVATNSSTPGSCTPICSRTGLASVYVNPFTLSWNLGNGIFVSFGEGLYLPTKSGVTLGGSSAPGLVATGPTFEQRFAISYLANGWIISANSVWGLETPDAANVAQPNYLNLDFTLARQFGKWEFGLTGLYSTDLNVTQFNKAFGRGYVGGLGVVVGYDFGPVQTSVVVNHGFWQGGTPFQSFVGAGATEVFATMLVPIWTPGADKKPAVAAKF